MNKKSKANRIKEKEKELVEAKRREAVLLSKTLGQAIEEVDRRRKTPEITSLRNRILTHLGFCQSTMEGITKIFKKFPEQPIDSVMLATAHNIIDTYKSIREDLKEVLKIDDDKLEKLFPERQTYFETNVQAHIVLFGIFEQENQMFDYLSRKT